MPLPLYLARMASLVLFYSIESRFMLNSLADFSRNRVVRDRSKIALSLLSLPIALATVLSTGQLAWANSTPNAASSLLPLEDGKMSAHRTGTGLNEAAESINAAFIDAQNPGTKSDELDLLGVPIIGEMLNENGKFDWGMDIPVSFDFGDLIGNPVLIVGTDFPTD